MTTPATVVIGDHTQGLGIVRSAAAAGGRVWVVNDKCLSLARFSRRLSGYRRLRRGTLALLERTECAEYLRDALLDLPFDGPATLFGVNEDITRFMHQYRTALQSRYQIPDVRLDAIYDKFVFNQFVPEPARITTRLCSEADVDAVGEPESFLLKGRCGNVFRRVTGEKAVCLAHLSREGRQRLFAALKPEQVLLQELVETVRPVVSLCSFSVEGEIKGLFGYEKLRQHPNRFGTGTYLRSVPVSGLKLLAATLLKRLHFTGISEIEFIHDPTADAYKVIEMNPRAWKSVHFATQCGQNLVALHLAHAAGKVVNSRDDYQTDRYWTDLATDVPQMFRERRVARYPRGCFECAWDRSDPLPALMLWTLFPLIALETMLPAWPKVRRENREVTARRLNDWAGSGHSGNGGIWTG